MPVGMVFLLLRVRRIFPFAFIKSSRIFGVRFGPRPIVIPCQVLINIAKLSG